MNKSEFLNKLVTENDLDTAEDLFPLPFKKGGKHIHIITRTGIEKIQYNNQIEVKFTVVSPSPDFIIIKAVGTMGATVDRLRPGNTIREVSMQTYGEASSVNTTQKYPVAMAEKRALARVVLKLCGAYRYNVYGEDEAEDFKRDK